MTTDAAKACAEFHETLIKECRRLTFLLIERTAIEIEKLAGIHNDH